MIQEQKERSNRRMQRHQITASSVNVNVKMSNTQEWDNKQENNLN